MPLAGHDAAGLETAMQDAVISIHVPLAGHDQKNLGNSQGDCISIHVPLAGHDPRFEEMYDGFKISIHVPLAGHDLHHWAGADRACISIHVPLAGHDCPLWSAWPQREVFQSTCPLRGTTRPHLWIKRCERNFNPRAPCGARQNTLEIEKRIRAISIHVPLAGHDCKKAQRLLCIFVKTG